MVTPLSLDALCTLEWSSVSLWVLVYPITSTSSDSEMDETDDETDASEETVDVEHSLTERRLDTFCTGLVPVAGPPMASTEAYEPPSCSSRRPRYRCSRRSWSLCDEFLRSWRSSVFIKLLALVSSPSVVCRAESWPRGTISFSFSRQFLKCALLFFSSSLCVVLSPGERDRR